MKVFLSHPMSGLTEEEVIKTRDEALDVLRERFGKVELIDNYYHENAPANAGRIWHLGTSIRMMEEADVVCFYGDWKNSPGCIIEHKICELYEIKTIEIKRLIISSVLSYNE